MLAMPLTRALHTLQTNPLGQEGSVLIRTLSSCRRGWVVGFALSVCVCVCVCVRRKGEELHRMLWDA
jgi:hypothetical protein